MSFVPVVAADGHVRQAGVTRHVDAVSIAVEFSRTAAAASVDDVASQHRHDAAQWGGAVQHRPWCILGRLRMLEVKGDDLDSELYGSYHRRRKRVFKDPGWRLSLGSTFPRWLCPSHRCISGTAACPGPARCCFPSEWSAAG